MRFTLLSIFLFSHFFAHAQKIKISAGVYLPNYVWEPINGRDRTARYAGLGAEFNIAAQFNKTSIGLGICHNKEALTERVIKQPGVLYAFEKWVYERPVSGIKVFVGYGLISKPHWKFGYSAGLVFYRSGDLHMRRSWKDGSHYQDSTWSGSSAGMAIAVTNTFHVFYKLNERIGFFFSPYIENRVKQFREINSSVVVLPKESSFLWGAKIGVQYVFQ